jgi:hypothetical protein
MLSDLCAGQNSTAAKGLLGLCIRCDRLQERGGMEPRARLESGVAVCENWIRLRMVQSKRLSERVAQ